MTSSSTSLSELLSLPAGKVRLAGHDPRATPGFDGSKSEGKQALADLSGPLADLQERLFAEGRTGGRRRLLVVLQGMDTSGKGGVMRRAGGLFDPQGLRTVAFGAPTRSEARHDFLWRIERQLPAAGQIGIFDRSHYEDVLVGRVRGLAAPEELERRYGAINAFETQLVAEGTTVVKCMLHISPDKQRQRLLERLDDPSKHWKYDPRDVDERALWPEYQEAYEIALQRCCTDATPWHVVPADRKWYRNWAVATLLHEALSAMNLGWPTADFDVEEERRRVAAS